MPDPIEEQPRFGERFEAWNERHAHRLALWVLFSCGALMMIIMLRDVGAIGQVATDPSPRSLLLTSFSALMWFALALFVQGRYSSTDVSKEASNTEVA